MLVDALKICRIQRSPLVEVRFLLACVGPESNLCPGCSSSPCSQSTLSIQFREHCFPCHVLRRSPHGISSQDNIHGVLVLVCLPLHFRAFQYSVFNPSVTNFGNLEALGCTFSSIHICCTVILLSSRRSVALPAHANHMCSHRTHDTHLPN